MGRRLILFDIDQTLILSAGCGRRAMETAIRKIFNIPGGLEKISMNGKTDTSILEEALTSTGIESWEEKKELVWESYLANLRTELQQSKEARVNPGIPQILAELEKDPNSYLGLLTGNIFEGAKTKLKHFGLWKYFPTGGFGDDHPDRNQVARIALNRCKEHFGITFLLKEVLVVGDSLRDIACAEAIGAKSVIVATGLEKHEQLAARKPFSLFHDFTDAEAVLSILQGKET